MEPAKQCLGSVFRIAVKLSKENLTACEARKHLLSIHRGVL